MPQQRPDAMDPLQLTGVPDGVELVSTLRRHDAPIGQIAWSWSGDLLATPSADRTVGLWNPMTGVLLGRMNARSKVVSASFRPQSQAIAAGCEDGKVRIWGLTKVDSVSTIPGGRHDRVAFSPDGNTLGIGGNQAVHLRSMPRGTLTDLQKSPRSGGFVGGAECVAFDPTGGYFAASLPGVVPIWRVPDGELVGSLGPAPTYTASALAFDPAGARLATAARDGSITLWDTPDLTAGRHWSDEFTARASLEGHTGRVTSLAYLPAGGLLASRSGDGTVRLWNSVSGQCVAVIPVYGADGGYPGVAFHPSLPLLATVGGSLDGGPTDQLVYVWRLDLDRLLNEARPTGVAYTTAKIVLVGDSGVGKTGLGWRLAHGEYRDHPSTHGQQFWLLDQLGGVRADGAQCEAILWDLAGQPDYRLTHALHLDDADLALVLFDPTRDDDPLRGVEYWLRHLGVGDTTGGRPAILVAARCDRGAPRITNEEIVSYCDRRGVPAYVTTSAVSGAGLPELLVRMRAAVNWDARPTTVTTATFKRIKDYVLGLKEQGRPDQVVLSPAELRQRIETDGAAECFTDPELLTAVGHLANHGYVTLLRTTEGSDAVLLAPELLNNLASSMVLEARRNPKGLGSLEEELLLSGGHRFPELDDLAFDERDILLDSAVARFLKHNICYRETDPLSRRVYLVFPELINLKKPADDGLTVEETVAYTVTGAVENVYSSLVVLLGYTSTFTRANQWRNQARYVMSDDLVCGFRMEAEREGELDFVLYFGANVGRGVRTLFQSLFENFLAGRELTMRRYEPVVCANGHTLHRAVVRQQLADGRDQMFCNDCGSRTRLPRADTPITLTRQQAQHSEAERRTATARSRFEQTLFRLKAYVTQQGVAAPDCFISYAWGDPAHERWVEHDLAQDLAKAGIDVILDRWENARIGNSVPRFVERVDKADRVIVVGTPLYRVKYDNDQPMRGHVVAAEGDLIGGRLIGTEAEKQSVLPVLLDGEVASALPRLLRGRVYADFRDADRYFAAVLQLLLSLYAIGPRDPISAELNRSLVEDR